MSEFVRCSIQSDKFFKRTLISVATMMAMFVIFVLQISQFGFYIYQCMDKVSDTIEDVLTDAVYLEGFNPYDEEEVKELSEKIAEALRRKYHIVLYSDQVSFEE